MKNDVSQMAAVDSFELIVVNSFLSYRSYLGQNLADVNFWVIQRCKFFDVYQDVE